MTKPRKIGILTGGGDAPGLNPAIKWVVKGFLENGKEEREVIGIKEGYKGLLVGDPTNIAKYFEEFRDDTSCHFVRLTSKNVRPWDRSGGTNLCTSRTNPYAEKEDKGTRIKRCLDTVNKLGLDCLVTLGGEDTQDVSRKLFEDSVKTIGIPKTIDKDLIGTDYTLGFSTALDVIAYCVDNLKNTAGSHNMVFVVETMGRNAGHLALQGGMASGAYIILIPEYKYELDRIGNLLKGYKGGESRYAIVLIAEGAEDKSSQPIEDVPIDEFGHKRLGGMGIRLGERIQKEFGYETRAQPLGHLQRGGNPNAYDRLMGRKFGLAASNLIEKGIFGRMVCLKGDRIDHIPIAEVGGKLNLVDVTKEYDIEGYNGTRNIL